MRSRLIGVLAIAALSAACARTRVSSIRADGDAGPAIGQATPPPAPAHPDEDDVREATMRWMFAKNASGMQKHARVLCLHFERGVDPPPSFMARFATSGAPVVPASACDETSGGVKLRATGAPGLAFRIDAIVWTDRDHATVKGGYYEAGLSASGNAYTLERKSGAWVVTKDETEWIS